MITFLTTSAYSNTHRALEKIDKGPPVRTLPYRSAFESPVLPRGTWVFTDCDRLSLPDRHAAGALFRCLRNGGARVLNDPARMPSRHGLLRSLHRAGLNGFDAYRYEEREVPRRWPVFLRTEGDHDQPLSGLIATPDALHAAAEEAIAAGTPITALIVIEYAAEPVAPGLFRRLSSYRVGPTVFACACAHDDNWLVKYGKLGIATQALYDDELRVVRDNPFEAPLRAAFEHVGIEYGRADFGLVGGRVQVYEINTNPQVAFPTEHPFATRLETYALMREHHLAALAAIDSPQDGSIAIEIPALERYQSEGAMRRARRVAWMPR